MALSVCVAAVVLAGTGCGTACKTVDSTPLAFSDGHTVKYASGYETYTTSDWNGVWLDFEGGREYQLIHHLNAVPTSPQAFVAFTAQPLPRGATGNASESPGNQTIFQAVDDTMIQVRNDTCEHFYLLVATEAFVDPNQIGAAGAAGATN